MADIRSKLNMLYSLEQLSSGENAFKKLHSLAKLIVTAVYLVCVASLGKYDLTRLTLFLAYPVLMMAMAQIPWKMILKRAAVVMPFCIFAGVSNLIFDRTVIAYAGKIAVTGGMLSFAMLLCRTLLCVSAILILVAVTPFSELMDQLRRLHVPELLVTLLEMVYRYIGVLGGRSIRDGDGIPFKRKRCKMARDFRIWLICRAVIFAQCRPGRTDLSSNAVQALYLT